MPPSTSSAGIWSPTGCCACSKANQPGAKSEPGDLHHNLLHHFFRPVYHWTQAHELTSLRAQSQSAFRRRDVDRHRRNASDQRDDGMAMDRFGLSRGHGSGYPGGGEGDHDGHAADGRVTQRFRRAGKLYRRLVRLSLSARCLPVNDRQHVFGSSHRRRDIYGKRPRLGQAGRKIRHRQTDRFCRTKDRQFASSGSAGYRRDHLLRRSGQQLSVIYRHYGGVPYSRRDGRHPDRRGGHAGRYFAS